MEKVSQPKSDNPRAVEISQNLMIHQIFSERTENTGERLYSLYDNALEKSDHV